MNKSQACVAVLALVCVFCLARPSAIAQQSPDEQAVWKLEHSYWEFVKAADLDGYRSLWHPNFLGWPSISSEPARKDRITDWITANTSKGTHLQSYTLKPAASQATGDLVVVHYWITPTWVDKGGKAESQTLRITHTWIRVGKGWQIISGMSSPEPEVKK